jgi:hypothetical protein
MKKPVLEDHKRKGKVFEPPLLSIGTFIETAWVDYSIPEFVWILLLTEKYGIDGGGKLFLGFSGITDPYLMGKIRNNGLAASMISSYSVLTNEDKKEILNKMKTNLIFSKFQNVFEGFINIYPECPLSFLIDKNESKDKIHTKKYIQLYKDILERFYNKTGYEASITLANVVNFLLSVDRLFITENSKIPELKEILDYPNTEESKHLASFLRAASGTFFNVESYDRSNYWVKYFWNQSIKLEPCTI